MSAGGPAAGYLDNFVDFPSALISNNSAALFKAAIWPARSRPFRP